MSMYSCPRIVILHHIFCHTRRGYILFLSFLLFNFLERLDTYVDTSPSHPIQTISSIGTTDHVLPSSASAFKHVQRCANRPPLRRYLSFTSSSHLSYQRTS